MIREAEIFPKMGGEVCQSAARFYYYQADI